MTMTRKAKWLTAILLVVCSLAVLLYVAASRLAKGFEPRIRTAAIDYLHKRFDSEVKLDSLRIQIPKLSPVRLLLSAGRGTLAHVEGDNLQLRHRGRKDIPPMLTLKHFAFDLDIGALGDAQRTIRRVAVDGLEIEVPPKGQRPDYGRDSQTEERESKDSSKARASLLIEEVVAKDAVLVVLPKDAGKLPLRFDIHDLQLKSVGKDAAMSYDASLENAKPPGNIRSTGNFGPWNAEEPGYTPLSGRYVFKDADLGVFPAIAGILNSTGQFHGNLSAITATGEARVPDFRITRVGNPVPLVTSFEVLVNGLTGDTILKPVHATLGSTQFTTSGGVIKRDGAQRRTITLDVDMPKGNLKDLLRLAMKGTPFMDGQIQLKTKIGIPPLSGKVREKLQLDGTFSVLKGQFLRSKIQDKVDDFSRRGQGQPKNGEIDDVFSRMSGAFKLDNEELSFRRLAFGIPGADIALTGGYGMSDSALDFHGTLRLQAKLSQTMTGWKRWVLKPLDPVFAKDGAGMLLRIRISGTASDPQFGLDHGKPK
jgi:AsmA-like C-terminal region